ncbi:MAG: hypothetical protein GC155_06115 [Alphaproteobacteria bacterium]|nr:hypothetical protein [Alphaproteobacteria bacterium]
MSALTPEDIAYFKKLNQLAQVTRRRLADGDTVDRASQLANDALKAVLMEESPSLMIDDVARSSIVPIDTIADCLAGTIFRFIQEMPGPEQAAIVARINVTLIQVLGDMPGHPFHAAYVKHFGAPNANPPPRRA